MNKDGTNTLLKVTTQSGREIMATKAKSFLTRKDNKIVEIRGDELTTDTYLPLMIKTPEYKNGYIESISLDKYLPRNKFIYGSEIEKARKLKEENNKNGNNKWFKDYSGKDFTVPYQRQDSLKFVLDGYTKQEYKQGCIYPRKGKDMTLELPENLPLDREFGFFIGAYLSEGCLSETYVAISNNDENYRKKVIEFCDKYKIGYHIVKGNKEDVRLATEDKYDVRIHSTLLAKLTKEWCGKLSHNKYVPNFAFNAPDEFVKGLIDSYFSGDGSVATMNGGRRSITASSVSKLMLLGITRLLSRYGIYSKMGQSQVTQNNLGTKRENIHRVYNLRISCNNIMRFRDNFTLSINYKQDRLDKFTGSKSSIGGLDFIPNNKLSFLKGDIQRDQLISLFEKQKIKTENDIKIMNNIKKNDVYYDKIMKIDEVQPTHKYVYDFTVANTKNFGVFNGILQRDSFHHSGVAVMVTTTQGVPRMQELLSLTKNIKTPQMIIYPTKDYMGSRDMANKIASYIEYTTLGDLRGKLAVYYDPDPYRKDGFIEKDRAHKVFTPSSTSKNSCQADAGAMPWLIRIELNREKLLEKEVTLVEIKSKLCHIWEKRHSDKSIKKEEKSILDNVTQISILSNTDYDKVPVLHIRFDMINFDVTALNGFIDLVVDNFKLKGISSITGIGAISEERVLEFDGPNHDVEKKKQYVIYTQGSNLYDIRYLNNIDINRTICNDIVAMYETFGIEAARASLLREIIYAYERGGASVNYQHVSLLIDMMTFNGMLTSIDRHGMSKTNAGPLVRASFEKTVDILLTAAAFSEVDYMTGVSSRIMAGLVIKGGTGYCNIILDTDMIQNSEFTEDIGQKYIKTYNDISKNTVIEDITNNEAENDMFIPIV